MVARATSKSDAWRRAYEGASQEESPSKEKGYSKENCGQKNY